MVLPLETGILYGPLYSRRLGLSLGVNLLPVAYKCCTFDCIYCHYGFTEWEVPAEKGHFPDPGAVLSSIKRALCGSTRFDTLTFSGNGEPTLHPEFIAIVKAVKQLRDQLRPTVKLTLFSNGSTVVYKEIQTASSYFDQPILKLDVGTQRLFEEINRPSKNILLDEIIESYKRVPDLIIQTLLLKGSASNSHPSAIHQWQDALADVRPAYVQLYSCDYPVPSQNLERVLPYELKRIAIETEQNTGISVKPYWVV